MGSKIDDTLEWRGLLTLLAFAPLPSGAIPPVAQALLTLVLFALLASWTIRHAPSAAWPWMAEARLRIILLCWALAVAFAFFQVVPLPPKLVAALSPSLADLYAWTLPEYEQGGGWRALSTTPGATIQSGLLIGACGAAFFLVTVLCRTRERILALALTVILVGAGEAIYGLAQMGGSLNRPASGTFVNRNHFSALLTMALCLGVGLLLARWQGTDRVGDEGREGAEAPELGLKLDRWARSSPLVVVSLTILAGTIFSFSRMGLSAPIVMLGLFGLFWLLGPVSRRVRLVGVGIVAVIMLLMGGAWPALGVVAERFQTLEDSYRVAAWEGTYALFRSSPIIGTGLGGLVDNLPRFLPVPFQEIFDHSHNEPLEILAEGGLVYAGLFGIGLLVYFGTLIPTWFSRRDPLARGLGLGCLAGATAVFLHSLVEFPLRMPANALYLSVIMGLGWEVVFSVRRAASLVRPVESLWVERQAHPSRASGSNDQAEPCRGLAQDATDAIDAPSQPSPSRGEGRVGEMTRSTQRRDTQQTLLTRLVIFTVALGGIGLSAVAGVADLLDRSGDGFVTRAINATDAINATTQKTLLVQASSAYQRANQIEPWQPAHTFRLGRVYEISATTLPPLGEETQKVWAAAASSYRRAVHLHPANARVQAALAWAALQSGDLSGGRRAAQASLKLAPGDQEVRFTLSRWYLMQWEALNGEEQRLAATLVRSGAREQPERYVEATWQLVHDPKTVRKLLPIDLPVRRLLLDKLTEGQLFFDRWAEQAAYPGLRVSLSENGLRIISQGQMTGRQDPPSQAAAGGAWTGMVEGWLSAGLTATVDLVLPPGEVVLYIPILGEAAGGVWPTLNMTLGGQGLPLPAVNEPGWRTALILVATQGGKFPLQAVLTNGTVIQENGNFVERRATLGVVKVLSASSRQ